MKFRATSLNISGDMTMNFGQHDSGFGQHDFRRDDFQAIWPVTGRVSGQPYVPKGQKAQASR